MSYVIKHDGGLVWIDLRSFSVISKEKAEASEIKRELDLNQKKRELAKIDEDIKNSNNGEFTAEKETKVLLAKLQTLNEKRQKILVQIAVLSQPVTEQREMWGIIMYSVGSPFEYFCLKHIEHSEKITVGTGSVLVEVAGDLEVIPSRNRALDVLEQSIQEVVFRSGQWRYDIAVPQVVMGEEVKLVVREWDFANKEWLKNKNTNQPLPPVRGYISFREIARYYPFVKRDPTTTIREDPMTDMEAPIKDGLYPIDKKKQVDDIIQDGRKPGAKYIVQYAFYVNKYFVANRPGVD